MELWDAYTRDGKLTDQVLVRDEPVPEGLYHLTCEVFGETYRRYIPVHEAGIDQADVSGLL